MTLIQSWRDSLQLLKPKNFKLFVMVTIKSIVQAYKLYINYFWWLLLIVIIFLFITPDYITAYNNHDFSNIALYATRLGMLSVLTGLLFLAVCFITRPSVLQKNCAYLRGQFKKIIFYWLLWGLLLTGLLVLSPWCMIISYLCSVSSYAPWGIFFVLFFADSEGGLKKFLISMWNAVKMVIYNLPLVLIVKCSFIFVVLFFNYLFFITPLLKMTIEAFLMPIGVCTFANIYIKRLHDQFDLYFKQPE